MYGGHKNNSVCDYMAHGPMDRVLLQLIESWEALKLPVRSIQLDDWWYIGSNPDSHDHMCVKEFAPKPDLFPKGLPPLPSQISYHLYGPFFCEDNVYRHNFSFANSSFEKEHDADPFPNASEALYKSLFRAQRDSGVVMTNYEVDFLQDQTQWFAPFVETVDGSARWLNGMATAAASLNIGVQYCMAHPAAFLQALSLPAVTNGRASGDYMSDVGNLLGYGTSAPFFAAVGIAPSKDNWWSTPEQPPPRKLPSGPPPCDGGSRNVSNVFLHALVATLSTGPVGFSDALGYSNTTLIQAACDNTGKLLKPSLPLAAIDRTFSVAASATAVPSDGHVWATHSAVDGGVTGGPSWYMVLAITVHTDWKLLRSDLFPQLPPTQDVVVWDYSDVVGSPRLVKAGTSELASMQTTRQSLVQSVGDLDYTYKLVTPVLQGGWALLGEPNKLVPVSVQRGWQFNVTRGSLLASLHGGAGENVTVAVWKGGKVQTQSVVMSASGKATATFSVQI
jgi:hypothetical protein